MPSSKGYKDYSISGIVTTCSIKGKVNSTDSSCTRNQSRLLGSTGVCFYFRVEDCNTCDWCEVFADKEKKG